MDSIINAVTCIKVRMVGGLCAHGTDKSNADPITNLQVNADSMLGAGIGSMSS